MSLKLSYDEAMGIAKTNPHSQFIVSSNRKHIKLMPKHLGSIKAGIFEQLDAQIFAYNVELGGVPVAYKNVRLVQNMGRIIADQSCVHFDIMADFVLFKPQVGCTLVGVINKVGKQHIGCLVHSKFNAWIPRLNPNGQTEELTGKEIQFVVTNIFTNNNILSLKGRVDESSFTILKKPKEKNKHIVFDNTDSLADNSNIVTLSQFEKGALEEHSPEQHKKKKRKKEKHKLADSVNEFETGDNNTDGEPLKKKKKKHSFELVTLESFTDESVQEKNVCDRKRKLLKDDLNDTFVRQDKNMDLNETNSASLKKKKRKKKQNLDSPMTETDQKIEDEKLVSIKTKKHSAVKMEDGPSLTEAKSKYAVMISTSFSKDRIGNDVSGENLEHTEKRLSIDSDEGYYSKKSKKKHKKKSLDASTSDSNISFGASVELNTSEIELGIAFKDCSGSNKEKFKISEHKDKHRKNKKKTNK